MLTKNNKLKRQQRVRSHIKAVSNRPRLSIYRSNAHITASLINDATHQTLLTVTDKNYKGTKSERSQAVGEMIAKDALKLGIKQVVFDRGKYRYHGRVKLLADSARSVGLDF